MNSSMAEQQVKLNKTMEEKKNNNSTTPESGSRSTGSAENKYYSSSTSSPSSNFTFEADLLPIDLPEQIILMKIHELLPKFNSSVICLQQTFDEVNLLQEENLKLTALNIDLEVLVARLENEFLYSVIGSSEPPAKKTESESDHISVEIEKKKADVAPRGSEFAPKAISVRSLNNPNCQPSILGLPKFLKELGSTGSKPSSQHLRVIAKSKDWEEAAREVELAVYKQGMTKTELCNKWAETGDCPYGEKCQFAHGVEELRPVLRHPKYKTTLCRMITSGGSCQYGHRCHFRHPNQEKELVL